MDPERWRRIEDLFTQAVECAVEERQQLLDRLCGGDEELRREVVSLLGNDAPAEKLVEIPDTLRTSLANGRTRDLDLSGRHIGRYQLIRLIGQGGMGAVYLGVRDDDQYRKQVAIKLLKRGMDTDVMLSRFRQERQILANLEHPFIARMMDGGATDDGLPYFVMEYVDGIPIVDYCVENKLTIPERVRLFRLVCEAVQYAHQNLVVHRDIKPGNILTTREGVPKLLDFGIAKVLDPGRKQGETLTGEFRMLTPDYASPEQVKGLPISTASDIYSLGAVLYQMLSGQRAHRFPSSSIGDMEKTVCETEPEMPSIAVQRNAGMDAGLRTQLRRELSGDLDSIVLAALRKEPQRRYASVADLSEDLRRHLEDLPILVKEDRWTYRASKFVRRNRVAVGAAVLIAASLVGGIFAATVQARRAERRFQEVRGLANSFLFDIHDQIEALPGSTRVREAMVSTVLKYLNNLAGEAGSDPSLQWELATAYQKIGDVQGYGVRPNLGQRAQAIESHTKALAMAEQLAARGRDPKVQRLLAVSNHRMGFLREGDQAHAVGGIDYYIKSEGLLEELIQASPGNPEDSPLLIMVYGHHGDAELLRGRMKEAAAVWQKALEVAAVWSARYPSDASKLALAGSLRRVSRGDQLNGALDRSLEHARQAIVQNEEFAAAQPASTFRQRELLNSYERLSFLAGDPDALNLGNLKMAYEFNLKVLAIAQNLYDADRNNRMAASDLAIAKRSACQFAPDDDPARVARECQAAVDTGRKDDFVEAFSLAAERLGPALLRMGKRPEAIATMETAIERMKTAGARWAWRADIARTELRLHNTFGAMLTAMGRRPEALANFRAALEIGERVLQAHPGDLVTLRHMADVYVSLGRHHEPSDRAQAADWYRKDLKVWTDWPRLAESSSLDRNRRAAALLNLQRCGSADPRRTR